MDKLPEWITAIGTLGTAFGVWLLWKQTSLAQQTLKDDHERSRRETAINYLFEWSRGLLQTASLARKLAESLNKEQAIALAKEKPFRLPADKKGWVLACLTKPPAGGLKEDHGEILLEEAQVAEIRWQVVRYLNLLESVLAGFHHNVADRDIMKEEFGYLVSSEEGFHALREVRNALGPKGYPAIADLEKTLEQQREAAKNGKAPIV